MRFASNPVCIVIGIYSLFQHKTYTKYKTWLWKMQAMQRQVQVLKKSLGYSSQINYRECYPKFHEMWNELLKSYKIIYQRGCFAGLFWDKLFKSLKAKKMIFEKSLNWKAIISFINYPLDLIATSKLKLPKKLKRETK